MNDKGGRRLNHHATQVENPSSALRAPSPQGEKTGMRHRRNTSSIRCKEAGNATARLAPPSPLGEKCRAQRGDEGFPLPLVKFTIMCGTQNRRLNGRAPRVENPSSALRAATGVSPRPSGPQGEKTGQYEIPLLPLGRSAEHGEARRRFPNDLKWTIMGTDYP
jgi:hypothetical protein